MIAEVFDLSVTRRWKQWEFPQQRFVSYETTDESWCRFFGIGKEIEVVETVTFPQAYMREIHADGTFEFGVIPSQREPLAYAL